MLETYEKDGIIYFKEPYSTNMTEWTEGHLDFDTLISSVDFDKDIAVVVAYSKDTEKLKKIRGNYQILGGLSTKEVILGISCQGRECDAV
ncbi:MAG: hypothetical protein K2N89_07660 [Lachnospiraceae bacterium]|nr:hypothetical protein [Lachnospiraceae bacterium]